MLTSRFAPIAALVLMGACSADSPTVPSTSPRALTAAAPRGVTITDLGVLPGYDSSAANAINDNGYIAGANRAVGFGPRHATLWDPRGRIADLGVLPPWSNSVGLGINASNVVVGYADAGSFTSFTTGAFRWTPASGSTPATMISLPVLNGGSSDAAYGVNDAGVVVGMSDANFDFSSPHAVRWDGLVASLLPDLPGALYSAARAINRPGDIVGESLDPLCCQRAVVWAGGSGPASVLAIPASILHASAVAINDGGEIAGSGQGSILAFTLNALYWSGPTATATVLAPLAPGAYAQATGINRSGSIVGWSDDASGRHAVYWRDSSSPALDLGFLPGQFNGMATAINRHDAIAGWNSGGPPTGSGRALCWSFRHSGC